MPEALIYFVAIALAVALVIVLDSKHSVAVEGDEIVVNDLGQTRKVHRDEIKAAMLRIDGLGSPVLVIVGSRPKTTVVIPVPRQVREDSTLRKVLDLLRGIVDRPVDVDPDVLKL